MSPESGSGIENLAYVIYTSGSTGQPKGVMVSHRALGSYVRSARGTYEISPQDRVLQFASISFDASVEEIFCCLAAGGTLVLRTESMLASPAEFLQKCQQWRITVLSLPTAYWHELAAHLEIGPLAFPSCLRLLIIGGERAIPDRLVTWRERGPAWVRLVNTYGPTEATVVATSWEADSLVEDVRSMGEVPIGWPLPHVQAYVLDRHLQPVPIGMPGELFLGGEGISKGYLNRAELTAEKFLPSLFGQLPTERLYRTGDVVRYRPDGNLEYLGRLDQQVKLRGYRIELGEIEAVLADHPEVRSAAARMWEDSSEERQIVAYVVADRKTPPPSQELRRFLRNRLPDFMVPSKLIFLDALPLTSSGKIDRLALPTPSLKEKEKRDHPVQAPRTPFEEMVACVWAEVLKVPQIGVEENFFELGGHSLLAIQVISRLGKAFSLNLPLRLLFESPTVAELATAIVERLVASCGEEEIAQVLQQGKQAEQE